jgi:hypothetical protein
VNRTPAKPLDGSIPIPLAFDDKAEFRKARRQWESLVRCDNAMTAAERLVVLHVAGYTGPTSPAWPSAETVAADLGMSARHVKRGLKAGRQRGWLLPVGRGRFAGSQRYHLSADETVASEVGNRLAGQRIIRQIRRENPDMRPAIRDARGPNDKPPRKGHRRPVIGDTGGPSTGTPVAHDPVTGTGYFTPKGSAASEAVVVLGHDKSPEPRAAHTSARATGGPQNNNTSLEMVESLGRVAARLIQKSRIA